MFFREWVGIEVSREACGSGKSDGGGSALAQSIAPAVSLRRAGDIRLDRPDRDQRRRLRCVVHRQQLLQVPQCLAQAFGAEQLPSN